MSKATLLLVVTAVLIAAGLSACVTSADPGQSEPISVIHSGSLPMAMNGVSSVAIHPSGRLIGVEDSDEARSLRLSMDAIVSERFQASGYRLASPDDADVLVAYAIGNSEQLSDESLTRAFGVSAGLELGSGALRGGIVLAIVSRQIRKVQWRASASDAVGPKKRSMKKRDETIKNAIDELLRELPGA